MKPARVILACAIGLLAGVAGTSAQPLVPLGDEVDQALLPASISKSDVEMSGEYVYLWKEEDGADVIHFVGDFQLRLGARRLAARQAVIWMTPRSYQGTSYRGFELLLWRDAKVLEPGGTVTRGPALFVTLNCAGRVRTSADRQSRESSAETTIYRRAQRIRRAVSRGKSASAAAEPAITVLDLGGRAEPPEWEVRPAISYQGRDMTIDQLDGRSVVTVIGDVYVFRGAPRGGAALELRADSAVVYFRDPAEEQESRGDLQNRRGLPGRDGAAELGDVGFAAAGQVEGIYLEGDIVLSSGERMIRAARLYYDFVHDRALILDAVMRMFEPRRSLPIYLRAEMVRQLSGREFRADGARLTTSEFYTPHYHIGAKELTLVDRTRRGFLAPAPGTLVAGTFEMTHATFNLGGVPLLFWPYIKGDVTQSETSIKSIRAGFSDDFGVEFESRWELFNVLGLEKPEGFDGSLLLDYFSERGPAVGVYLDYETDDYFGLYRGYYIRDTGRDNLGGRLRDEDPDSKNRGRTTLRHRQYLPDDWELTLEASYISDKNFLEEYFEKEFDTGKEQETLLRLKKQVDNWALTGILQYRVMDFLTATERLPDFSFRLVGEPIGDFASLFSENRAGFARYRPADRGRPEQWLHGGRRDGSGTVARADTRQELDLPLTVGDLKFVPFGSIRGTAWDDTPRSGGRGRAFGTYGLRGSTYAWRTYPQVKSDLADLDGLRHVVKTDVVAWASHSNRDSDRQFPFDENVEGIDEVDGVSVGLRQRLQTRRGGPGRRRTVDVVTFDVEVGLFNDAESDEFTNGYVSYSRPENSVSQNYLNTALVYRISDATDFASEMNFDLNDGEVDVFTATYAVQRTPRLKYVLGYRYIGEIDSNLLGFALNYRISEKYLFALREEFDIQRGDTALFDVGVIRKFPRWYVGVTFALDRIEDDFGVSFSAWPEGLPRAVLGSRRFTGLVTSTGMRPGS